MATRCLSQSVLEGKAYEVYSAMSIKRNSQYNVVRKAFNAFKLVPEAYQQNFRNKKVEKQIYTKFA